MANGAGKNAAIKAAFMVAGMLITGTANTLLNKNQDMQCVKNCDGTGGEKEDYSQPVWQTLNMFIGETLCLIVYLIANWINPKTGGDISSSAAAGVEDEEKQRLISDAEADEGIEMEVEEEVRELAGRSCFLLWIPTMFDIIGTTLMNIGLLNVAASIYQMLRGAVVIFTGILSILFLKAKMPFYRGFALFVIILGVSIVGMSPILFGTKEAKSDGNPLLGVALVLFAQLFTAMQFVTEEKILLRYTVTPIKMVGLEGIFGLFTTLTGMIIMHFAYGQGTEEMFDIVYGFQQFIEYPRVWGSGIAIAFSIGAFNWFGLNITKFVSATSRSTIDTCRTLFVWLLSLLLGWEAFLATQLVGFTLLIYGTFVFNNVISPCPPGLKCPARLTRQQ